MDPKSIFLSKTFWLNVIGIAVTVAQVIPPQYGLPALAILNIINRFLTSTPVNISSPF